MLAFGALQALLRGLGSNSKNGLQRQVGRSRPFVPRHGMLGHRVTSPHPLQQAKHRWMAIAWSCFLDGLPQRAGCCDQCHGCSGFGCPGFSVLLWLCFSRGLVQVRNLCPYALRGCQILQNVCNNPEMNPEYMEAWMVDRVPNSCIST